MTRAILLLSITLYAQARADGSFGDGQVARVAAAEVATLPEQATLRLLLSLDRHHGCSLSFDTVQQRAEWVLEIDGARATLRVRGTERHVSGGRSGVNDGPPRVSRDETHAIAAKLSGTVTRTDDALAVRLAGATSADDVPLDCRIERVGKDGSDTDTVRALVCATRADKPLRLGSLHGTPRLPFGRGDGYALYTMAERGGELPVKVTLATR